MLTVTNIGNTFNDLLVVNAARVSFGKRHNSLDPVKDPKLISYLVKHDHWSPLAHPHATVKLYFTSSDTLEKLIQRNDILAGLTLRKGKEDNLWVITGSLWALLKLSYFIPNHHLFWHIYQLCPASTEAFIDRFPPPFKMDDSKTHKVEAFIPNDDTYTFHIKAPIFVARQLVKHQQKLVWNEVSRRYVDSEPEFYDPKKMPQVLQENSGLDHRSNGSELLKPDDWKNLCGWRGKASDKKQGSREGIHGDVDLSTCYHYVATGYSELIQDNYCPEQARMVLPQSMLTEWYWSGTREAFQRVVDLRTKPDTQLETQYIAKQIEEYLNVN